MVIQTQEKLLKDCYNIVLSFLKERKLEDFWEPVKWKELGLYDYLEKIKTPMDLTTMKNKFETNQYKNVFEFAYDMRLMWRNCFTYNQDGCIVVEIAKRYQHIFEERFTKLMNSNVTELASVLSNMKRNLFKEIAKLDHDKVSHIIQMIWEICPDAIVEGNETLEVDVDHLTKYAYYMISAYLNTIRSDEQKQEEVKQEEVKQEEVKQEEMKQEEVKQEEIMQEEVKQEEMKQEEMKQEKIQTEMEVEQTADVRIENPSEPIPSC